MGAPRDVAERNINQGNAVVDSLLFGKYTSEEITIIFVGYTALDLVMLLYEH